MIINPMTIQVIFYPNTFKNINFRDICVDAIEWSIFGGLHFRVSSIFHDSTSTLTLVQCADR